MVSEIEKLIEKIRDIQYNANANVTLRGYLAQLGKYIDSNHFLNSKVYQNRIADIDDSISNISSYKSSEDRLLQRKIQKNAIDLVRQVLDENKKIFVVHGRNTIIRDKVSTLLGRLKLDYVVLESEHNGGATIIEKFLRNASDCRYAIILLSGDDIGGLNQDGEIQKIRARQNVILELGYFLSSVGRKNIFILHDANNSVEKPSDFDGIVHEPFDDYGAWKGKLIKELKHAKIYIDSHLADRV